MEKSLLESSNFQICWNFVLKKSLFSPHIFLFFNFISYENLACLILNYFILHFVGTELDSIRALFCEKEKELDLAVSKVEELTRQLDEIRKNGRKNYLITSTSELENLRRELTVRIFNSENFDYEYGKLNFQN